MKRQEKEQSDFLFFLVGILSVIAGALAYTYLSGGKSSAVVPRKENPDAASHAYENNTHDEKRTAQNSGDVK